MPLSRDDFRSLVRLGPLVAIDLVVERDNRFLLGLRTNRPAMGFLFVPGGRVYKDERLDDAFRRIAMAELGVQMERSEAEFLGVYEHLYSDSMFDPEASTHYVVLAHRVKLVGDESPAFFTQHSEAHWMSREEILADKRTHANTRAYFV